VTNATNVGINDKITIVGYLSEMEFFPFLQRQNLTLKQRLF